MQDIEKIYHKFLNGECSRQEAEQLLDYFRTQKGDDAMVRFIAAAMEKTISPDERLPAPAFSFSENLNRLMQQVKPVPKAKVRLFSWWYAAAAAILLLAFGAYFYKPFSGKLSSKKQLSLVRPITPGTNKATLTLANGSKVELNSAKEGIQVKDDNISYNDGTKIGAKSTMLTLTTPRGGKYQVQLSDGTNVWLNAASSLTYPSSFDGPNRTVTILGEAYFSVAPNGDKPFKVISKGQEISVLGTDFNVSAYESDATIKTTLVKGAVLVSAKNTPGTQQRKGVRLLPGEQSQLSASGALTKQKADITASTAWKEGIFYFDNTPFTELMKQLSRWYDIEVVYHKNIPTDSFSGSLDRNVSLQTVLDFLDESGIVFKVDGRKLLIN
ncbi:FecR family protein [bacterium A37T11]|nr:FecR family protein [bacterium A37T11]